MPTWGQILNELQGTLTPQGAPDFDGVRRKYLQQLYNYTHRAVILYVTSFLESKPAAPADLQINTLDVQGFMEAVSNVQERQLDLIIHSPGGLAEAAEAILRYLRTRFDHIRAIIPLTAMSAATMLALGADEIVMGRHSQLGPIDPQFVLATPEGPRAAPAQAILDQFEQAKVDCQNPANLAAWMPILRGYGPGLLAQCQHQKDLAIQLVTEWLSKYMFANTPQAPDKAAKVASWFADYQRFKSHNRPVRLEDLQGLDLSITPLESDQRLQDGVLSVHHAAMHTLSMTLAVKIIENQHGRAFVKNLPPPMKLQIASQPQPSQPQPQLSRAERRRQERGR